MNKKPGVNPDLFIGVFWSLVLTALVVGFALIALGVWS